VEQAPDPTPADARPRSLGRSFWLPLLAFSAMTLVLGYWLKARCAAVPWVGGFEFRNYCYSDVRALYWANGYADGRMPYVDVRSEYPVITGIIPWILTRFFHNVNDWWHANAVLLFLAGLGVTYCLGRAGHDWRAAAPWILAPSLVIDGFTNWDLWATLGLVAGLVLFLEGRLVGSGVAIGLGTAAKFFPAVVGPGLALVLVNRARNQGADWRSPALRGQLAKLAGGFVLGWLPVNLPFILRNRTLWWETYRFHEERGTTYQTIGYFLDQKVMMPHFDHALTTTEFNRLALVLTLLGMVVTLAIGWRRRSEDAMLLSTGLLAVFVAAGKVYSLQYALWLLPLFVLARLPRWLWYTFTAAHVVSYVWAYHMRLGPWGEFVPLFEASSFVLLVCICMMVVIAWRRLSGTRVPVTAPSAPEAASSGDVVP